MPSLPLTMISPFTRDGSREPQESSMTPVEEEPGTEDIPGVTAPPTRRQVKGFKKWMKLAAREHADAKLNDKNDAAKAAAEAIAHIFEWRKFGN